MSAPPIAGLGLCLSSPHYSLLLRWHLGEPLARNVCAGRPCAACGAPIDVFGDHAVSCAKVGFGPRHHGIQSFLCRSLAQAHLPHDREVDVVGDGTRPADVLLKCWEPGGRDLAVDLTVTHLCPNSVGRPGPGTAGKLAKKAEEEKVKGSEAKCAAAGCGFSPLVMDTWGGIHGAGRALWTDIASRCAAHVAERAKARAVGVLRQGLGVTLARAVATQLEHLLEVGPASPAWWAEAGAPLVYAVDAAGNETTWGGIPHRD